MLALTTPPNSPPPDVTAATGDPLAEALELLRDIRSALSVPKLADRLAVDAVELAAALCISERMVWTLNSTAELPAPFKIGARTLWNLAELREWLAAGAPNRATWERTKSKARK